MGAAALPLAACGFEPVYAPGGSLDRLRNRIRFAEPNTRNDFKLRSELQSRLGNGTDFDLSYLISTQESDVGITPDQVITRQQITGQVDITLTDQATGAVLEKATLSAITSYGTTDTTASTAFAREAAFDRLMVMLADRIVSRLALLSSVPG